MPVVPVEQALEHVDIVGASLRRMAFARIKHQLGLDAEMLERAVESFRLADRIALVVLAVEDQRRRARVADMCGGRVAREDFGMFPRRAEIPFIAGGVSFGLE